MHDPPTKTYKDTEGVDSMLRTFLPKDQYFRFNPSIEPFDIDEIRYASQQMVPPLALFLALFVSSLVHSW